MRDLISQAEAPTTIAVVPRVLSNSRTNPDISVQLGIERKGFYPQCLHKTREQSKLGALRIKPCWTEALVTRANLASSMGIVKRKALGTKLVQQYQVSRLQVGAGRVVVGRRVQGARERACGDQGIWQRSKNWVTSRRGQRPESAGQKSTVVRVAAGR